MKEANSDPGVGAVLVYGFSMGLTAVIFLIIGLIRGTIPDSMKIIALITVILCILLLSYFAVSEYLEYIKRK